MDKSFFLINCGSCGKANRIPAGKEGLSGRCGHCHARLLPLYYQPQPLTEKGFDDFIRAYPGLVLAEFWAPW
jgi:thioredoxin 2